MPSQMEMLQQRMLQQNPNPQDWDNPEQMHMEGGWGHHHGMHGPGCCCPHCGPPPCPPGPGWGWNWRPPLGAIRGPIIGVTDGSVAKQGEVGEYLYGSVHSTVTEAQSGVDQFVAPLSITAGDWLCSLTLGVNFGFLGTDANMSPVPVGIRIPDDAAFIEMNMAPTNVNAFTGQRNFSIAASVNQLLSVRFIVNGITGTSFDSNNVSGQVSVVVIVDARRMR